MIPRTVVIVAIVALGGLALGGAPFPEDKGFPPIAEPAAASTCDGWPQPIPKLLEECPHGPTP